MVTLVTEGEERRLFGRRRRANVPAAERRDHRYVVRASPSERVQLEARAAVQGVTVARLMVEAALSEDGGETDTQRKELGADLFAVRRAMATVANNVNQLAKFANAEGRFPQEAQAVLEEYRATVVQMRSVLDRLSGR